MSKSLPPVLTRSLSMAMHYAQRLGRFLVGLAQDFWKDGNWGKEIDAASSKAKSYTTSTAASPKDAKPESLWHALPSEIAEKMWGEGYILPADAQLSERLISPLGLTKDMTLLDLSAGLGERLRKVAKDFGIPVQGREEDAEIAARGHALSSSLEHYDPLSLSVDRKHDCVIAREMIYRISDKAKFIKAIVSCCKPQAQISFTDYVVNPEARNHPAIAAWYAYEKGANALGLIEMAELWAKEGVNIRVHDDVTDFYKTEVKNGLARFAKLMESGLKTDAMTAKTINKQIGLWAHRMAAIEHGMKFYRFYGQR